MTEESGFGRTSRTDSSEKRTSDRPAYPRNGGRPFLPFLPLMRVRILAIVTRRWQCAQNHEEGDRIRDRRFTWFQAAAYTKGRESA